MQTANSAVSFKPGDRVQWTESYQRGSTLHITCKHGSVISIDSTNVRALVREDRSKRKKEIQIKKLKSERDIAGPLTELIFAMAGQPLPEHLRNPVNRVNPVQKT